MLLREQLQQAPFTLALSSGFFGFFAHYGLTLALREAGLAPVRVTGASAGAVVAAVWAHGLSNQEFDLVLKELKRDRFWDPHIGAGFLKGEKLEDFFREVLQGHALVMPYAISTFDIKSRQTRSFTQGDLPLIMRASCAVPLMFHPVVIDGRPYWDGGILDKAAVDSVHGRKRDLAGLENQMKIIPHGLAAVGPNKLALGPQVVEQAFEHARKCLNSQSM